MLICHANMSHYFPRKKKRSKEIRNGFLNKKKKEYTQSITRNLFQKKKNFHKFNLTTGFRILLDRLRVLYATSGVLPASVSPAAGELPIATVFSFPDVGDAFEL